MRVQEVLRADMGTGLLFTTHLESKGVQALVLLYSPLFGLLKHDVLHGYASKYCFKGEERERRRDQDICHQPRVEPTC